MKVNLSIMCLCIIFIMIGCATPGTTTNRVIPASLHPINNEKYVDTPPEVVWNNLVKGLAVSYFMINNIDKESRIINVSFSNNDVSKYVDCGRYEVKVKKSVVNINGSELYNGNICDTTKIIIDGSYNPNGIPAPVVCTMTRIPILEGRMNIYIAPKGNGTLVTVNCRYIINVKLKADCELYAPAGNLIGSKSDSDSYSCSTDSKSPCECNPLKGDSFICGSTGVLEDQILSMVE